MNDRPSTSTIKQQGIQTQGILYNYNTIEEFKKADKAALLSSVADSVSRKSLASPHHFC